MSALKVYVLSLILGLVVVVVVELVVAELAVIVVVTLVAMLPALCCSRKKESGSYTTTIICHKRDLSQSLYLSLLSRLAICPNVQIPRL